MRMTSFAGLGKFCRRIGFKARQHSPELLIAGGIITGVTAVVAACTAVPKAAEVTKQLNEDLNFIHDVEAKVEQQAKENPEAKELITKKDIQRNTTKAYAKAVAGYAKAFAPAAILEGTSIACTLGGYNIMNKRNAALTATAAALERGFKAYRKRVADKLGIQEERAIALDLKPQEMDALVTENGETKVVKETALVPGNKVANPYARFFDESCRAWTKSAEVNRSFLIGVQNMLNENLKRNGVVYLNDVYSALGCDTCVEGTIVGWVFDPDNKNSTNCIDFGIYDINNERARAFLNGYERNFLMDIVPDGVVHELWKIRDQHEREKHRSRVAKLATA